MKNRTKYIGIDVAGPKRDQVIAVLNERLVVKNVLIRRIRQKKDAQWLAMHLDKKYGKNIVVAIDAPRTYAKGPTYGRKAEKELRKRGLANPIFAPPKHKFDPILHAWMRIGQWMFEAFGKNNKNVIEVFPTASYKQFSNSKIKFSIPIKFISKKLAADITDATCAALTAQCYKKGLYEKCGDKNEGFIIIPKKNNSTSHFQK